MSHTKGWTQAEAWYRAALLAEAVGCWPGGKMRSIDDAHI
jgi:hypothetical protein